MDADADQSWRWTCNHDVPLLKVPEQSELEELETDKDSEDIITYELLGLCIWAQ
jgi:hypothetical protein